MINPFIAAFVLVRLTVIIADQAPLNQPQKHTWDWAPIGQILMGVATSDVQLSLPPLRQENRRVLLWVRSTPPHIGPIKNPIWTTILLFVDCENMAQAIVGAVPMTAAQQEQIKIMDGYETQWTNSKTNALSMTEIEQRLQQNRVVELMRRGTVPYLAAEMTCQ